MRVFVDVKTGVIVTGNIAKWRLKRNLAMCAEYDGRLRYKDVREFVSSQTYNDGERKHSLRDWRNGQRARRYGKHVRVWRRYK